MVGRALLLCSLVAALSLARADAQQDKVVNPTVRVPEKNAAEKVFGSTASKVVFLITRKSGELHARASGIILTADGYIATNYHALQGADAVEIRFFPDPQDSENYQSFNGAKLLYANAERDIAVLKVNAKSLPFAQCSPVTNCESRVGQAVYAIGNPKGLNNTISEGIVSALRSASGEGLIQHTAAISPGSSGGALLDSSGSLLGMNSWQVADGQSLNFAISAEHLLEALAIARRATVSLGFPPDAHDEDSQEGTDKTRGNSQRAVDALRALAQRIKECQATNFTWPDKTMVPFVIGPPKNLTWDAVPRNSARSPYAGFIQFIISTHYSLPTDRPYKDVVKYQRVWDDFLKEFPTVEFRYEFDLGPDGLELTSVLLRRENQTGWKAAELSCACWGVAALKGKSGPCDPMR